MNSRLTYLASVLWLAAVTFSCKPRQQNAESAVKDQQSSSDTISFYRFARRVDLLAYDRVPIPIDQSVWRQYSRPMQTYARFRQGVYVCEHPALCERYGINLISELEEQTVWLARFDLDRSCFEQQKIGAIQSIINGERFASFLKRRNRIPRSAEEFARSCPQSSFVANFDANDAKNLCSETLADFYDDPAEKISVVEDHFWPGRGFWFLRNANCVVGVKSSPAEVLELLDDDKLWSPVPQAQKQTLEIDSEPPGAVLFTIFVRALLDLPNWDDHLLDRISDRARNSRLDLVQVAVPALVEIAKSCKASGKSDRLREQLRRFHTIMSGDNGEKFASSTGTVVNQIKNYVNYNFRMACELEGNSDIPRFDDAYTYFNCGPLTAWDGVCAQYYIERALVSNGAPVQYCHMLGTEVRKGKCQNHGGDCCKIDLTAMDVFRKKGSVVYFMPKTWSSKKRREFCEDNGFTYIPLSHKDECL